VVADVTAGARVGVDIGGTFTDAVMLDGDARLVVAKVRTTPDELSHGFLDGLDALGKGGASIAPEIGYLVHGTTVATNALVQKRTARVGLITTAGFRDVLEIGTQQRPLLYDLRGHKPAPLVPRGLRREVRERIGPNGRVVAALDSEDVKAAAADLQVAGVEAVAVAFLFSFLEPAHEREVGRLLGEFLPGVPVSLSSDVAPEFREYPSTSTTALNAGLLPLIGGYVEDLAGRLAPSGVGVPLHLMQSNGGIATAGRVSKLPITLIASGPAAGVIGAARLAAATGHEDVLTFDMGGTTADVALVVGATPQLRFRGDAEGHPIALPQVDVMSVGSGGGSIARVDDFGSLLVGPESAGAHPGPAGYGLGGEHATLTDAHLVLGTLDPQRFLGGRMSLDVEAARKAVIRGVAEPLQMSAEEAASAIVRIADTRMAGALRLVSVERGHDPRRFTLVAFGGAGPMHACSIAEQMGVERILIPRHPGVTSALGLLLSDVRHDLRRTWIRRSSNIDPADFEAALGDLVREAYDVLEESGFAADDATVAFELDVRYSGQAYELTVPLAQPVYGALDDSVALFHQEHEKIYGHSSPVEEVEVVTLRAHAGVASSSPAWDFTDDDAGSRQGTRDVWSASGPVPYRVIPRSALSQQEYEGPLIVEQADSTLLIPSGWFIANAEGGTAVAQRMHRP
jgi:N-methylhydantoinase A